MPLFALASPRSGRAVLRFFQANHAGAMLAIPVPSEVANRIALPGGEPPEDLHITLFYFGDAADVPATGREAIIYTAIGAVGASGPLEVTLEGTGVFEENEERPLFARVNSPKLEELRAHLARVFDEADIAYSKDHEYRPHVTLKYLNAEPAPAVDLRESFVVPAVEAHFAEEVYRLSLFQRPRHFASRVPAGQKQRKGSGDYEGLTNRQQRALVKAYDTWAAKVKKELARLAEGGAGEARLTATLQARLPELEAELTRVTSQGVDKAARVAVGAGHMADDVVRRVVAEEKASITALVRESLIPNIEGRLTAALAVGVAAITSAQLRDSFNGARVLPAQYAGGAWVAIFRVQQEAGKEVEKERKAKGLKVDPVRWVLDPAAAHCHPSAGGYYGCPELAKVYPGGWNSLPTVPAGQVTCRGNCRCHIEVYRDGEWRRGLFED